MRILLSGIPAFGHPLPLGSLARAARAAGHEIRLLTELLRGVEVVVKSGGASTVLATLSRGIPMVVLPQGADQFINAERAASTGSAAVVHDPSTIDVVAEFTAGSCGA